MSLSPAVRREYDRIRSRSPRIGAVHALRWARSIVEPSLPEGVEQVDESQGEETVLARGTVEDFDVVIYTVPDYDSEPFGTFTDTWSEQAVPNPRWRFSGLDEYGQVRRDRDTWRYFVPESGETERGLREAYNKSGMSRGVAGAAARASLREEAQRAGGDREVYAVGARVSRAGVLLAEERLYGCDVTGEHGRRALDRAYLLDTGSEVLSEALGEAQERLDALVASARQG